MAQRTKHYITRTGLDDLQKEYEFLTTVKRAQVIQHLQQTREMGDLAENSAYDDAREEQSLLESRIEALEKALKSSIVTQPQQQTDFVVIGSNVSCEMNGEIRSFVIVGSVEADPEKGKISNESPVGKALLGTRLGEIVEIQVGPIKSQVKVLTIR